MENYYQKVACIALRKNDGSIYLNVPLYIRLSEINPSGLPDTQESVISQITEAMSKHYEQQLKSYYQKLKNKDKSWKQFCLSFSLSR